MTRPRAVQTLAITSGKGGSGKTQLALNLSMALAAMNRRVLLLDGDLGLGNAAVAMGLEAAQTIGHVVAGEAKLREIVLQGPGDIKLIPAASGVQALTVLNSYQLASLIHGFSDLADEVDTVIVDTASGISELVTSFACASQEVLVVICNEPASLLDAMAVIKAINERSGQFRFRVVANMVRNAQEGKAAFSKLRSACDEELEVALDFLGHVPFDENLRLAAQRQKPLSEIAPRCRAAKSIQVLGERIAQFTPADVPGGHLEFFVENLIQADR